MRRTRVRIGYARAVTGPVPSPLEGLHVLERLRAENVISQSQMQAAMIEARRMNDRAEEALLRTEAMSEADLLKWLATTYRTRFVSTEKLARADVERGVLRMVPRRICTRLTCFPVLFQSRTQTLVVVAADLEAQDVAKQIQLVTSVAKVSVMVARPAAIQAAIAKHYDGRTRAFVGLVASRPQSTSDGDFSGYDPYDTGTFSTIDGDMPTPVQVPLRSAVQSAFTIEAPEVVAGLQSLNAVPSMPPVPEVSGPPPSSTLLDMVHVFVALLDRERGDLRDHGAAVARLCGDLCERLGVRGPRAESVVLAGYLHDVGKTSSYHLTAYNVAKYEGHRLQAEKTHLAPVRLFESARVSASTARALTHVYERFDGTGFPERLSGTEIPLGARVLALAESYADLTGHGKNPFRRRLSAAEACDAIEELAPSVFDPSLVELLRQVALGSETSGRDRPTVLVVDPDPDDTTVLDIRLSSAGYAVAIARDAADAVARVEAGGIRAIITEVDLPGDDGFTLVETIRRTGAKMPVLFLTQRGDRASVQRGFELGAADYLVKPASPEVVVEKTRQLFEGASARGVAGSLSEMSLADVTQIMGNGRKTGRLVIRSMGRTGEINFGEGQVWDARFDGERGEEAFYRLLLLDDGDFSLDTSFTPTVRLIQLPTESLLLEGMRRLDESSVL